MNANRGSNNLFVTNQAQNYANAGLATVGDISLGAITMNATSGTNRLVTTNIAKQDVSKSVTATVGNTQVGDINLLVKGNNHNTVTFSQAANTSSSYSKGVASVGNVTLGNISIDNVSAAYGAKNTVRVYNHAYASSGAAATVGTINVGDISTIKNSRGGTLIEINNIAGGYDSHQADVSGLITVGNIHMSATVSASVNHQTVNITNHASNGNAGGIKVGDVEMIAHQSGWATFTANNYGRLGAGNIDIGNVTLDQPQIHLHVSNSASQGDVGTTTIGNINLSGLGYRNNIKAHASNGSVGLVSIGNVSLSATESHSLIEGVQSWASIRNLNDLNDGVKVNDITINLAFSSSASYNTCSGVFGVVTNGNIQVGNININATNVNNNPGNYFKAAVSLTAQSLTSSNTSGSIHIGNITVSRASATMQTDNFGNLVDIVKLNTAGTINVGNIDYSGYEGATTIDVSHWLGAGEITGSVGAATITDNSTVNIINLNVLGNNTINLLSDQNTANHDTINNAHAGDTINSYVMGGGLNSLSNNEQLSGLSSYNDFVTAAVDKFSTGDEAVYATVGSNTYIAMINAAHNGMGEIVELHTYTGVVSVTNGHIVLS